ncbi:hypothetical protein BGZ99_010274 [Dissophora globulifera]|uniref:Uncharacterized protein n=1 Tax=Dissophora globulifera TaxID=979702 RepID=A0A9P6R4X1_9FUNG|nr:hypothetical protein BGZ99_010274 [Dissophora globulifera]
MQRHTRTSANTRALFRGPHPDDAPDFMAEDEQEEFIESLRISNDKANDMFKASQLVLLAFSGLEILTWYKRSGHALPDPENPWDAFRESASPMTATVFSLISFSIGIFMIRDASRIARDSVAVWAFVSLTPLVLMARATELSFELLWWSMPLLLQAVDLASLWIMRDPDEDFFQLEKSQYKLKGA